MPDGHLLGPFVRRFLLEEVVADRNLTLNTQRSYRDSIRLLLRFLHEHHAIEPTRVTVEQITAAVARTFLAHLEEQRGNSVSTRNQRLAAIHSLFRFVARQVPELVDHAAQILAIPLRRSAAPTMAYLEKPEIDALLARDILAGTSADPHVLRLLPPLSLTGEHVDRLASALGEIGNASL